MVLPCYDVFLRDKCAHCFETLKSEKNRMIKILSEYPKCEEDWDLSSEPEITNFDAISTLYGHSKKSLAEKFVEQFKSSLTNGEFVLSLEVSNKVNMCPLMMTSENLAFCIDCGLLFTQVYRINKTFRNLSNKNSLLCKTMPELFSIIDDNQLSALDEWEMKIENETPEIEDPSEDPLMVDNNLNECEEDAFFDNNVEEYNSENKNCFRGRYSLRDKAKRFNKGGGMSDDDLDAQENEKLSSDFVESGSELSEKEYIPVKKSKQIKQEESDKSGKNKISQTKNKRKNEKPYISVPTEKRCNIQKYNYICRECGNRFQSITAIRFHLLSHTKRSDAMTVYQKVIKGPPYHCPKCSKKFKQHRSLMMHTVRCHNIRLLTTSEMKGKRSDQKSCHNCSECGMTFDGIRGLGLHYSKMHKISLYICVECDVGFLTKAELDSHSQDEDHNRREVEANRDQSSMFHDTDDETTENSQDAGIDRFEKETQKTKEKLKKGALGSYKEVFKGPPFICPECKKSYQNILGLRRHCAKEHDLELPRLKMYKKTSNSLKCDKCGILHFKNFEQFEAHHRTRHNVKYIPCQWCPKMFLNTADFKTHNEKFHSVVGTDAVEYFSAEENDDKQQDVVKKDKICDNKSVCCQNCQSKVGLKNRCATEHSLKLPTLKKYREKTKSLKCVTCEIKHFKSFDQFEAHHRTKHKLNYIQCQRCAKVFTDKKEFETHNEKMHPLGGTDSLETETEEENEDRQQDVETNNEICEEPFFCRQCNFSFKNMVAISAHNRSHQSIKNYDCKNCSESFKNGMSLLHHLSSVHSVTAHIDNYKDSYRCTDCEAEEVFDTFPSLQKHFHQFNHSSFNIMCAFCEKQFQCKNDLKLHKVLKHDKKYRTTISMKRNQLECPFCDLTFPSIKERILHRLTHPKEEQLYKCKECPKVYTTTNSLNAHREIMHMEKFQCDECGKSIAGIRKYRSHCKWHIEMASGVKPLCDLCGKTYSSKKQLQKHKYLTHSRKEEKHCEICGYVSKTKWYFKQHMKVHAKNGTIKPKKKKWYNNI